MKVYVLTEEYNQYDQYEEYFLKVFKNQPTDVELMKLLKINQTDAIHILNGGGRIGVEDNWYILTECDI